MGHTREYLEEKPSHEDRLSPEEHIEALFAGLSDDVEKRRREIVRRLSTVANAGAARLNPPPAARPQGAAPLDRVLLAALPAGHAERLELLDSASRAARDEAVLRVLAALDAYLSAHEPEEDPTIADPVERRKDLVRQKRALAEEVSTALERLGFTLCCPSGRPGSLKAFANERNTKGQFRLVPRGTGQPEASRASLRDLLPFLRFAGADAHHEPSREGSGEPHPPSASGRTR